MRCLECGELLEAHAQWKCLYEPTTALVRAWYWWEYSNDTPGVFHVRCGMCRLDTSTTEISETLIIKCSHCGLRNVTYWFIAS